MNAKRINKTQAGRLSGNGAGLGCWLHRRRTGRRKTEKEAAWQFHDIAGIELIQKNAMVPRLEGVLIVDSRPYKPKYVNGHIPTAISIPFSQFDKMTDKLPKDKQTLLIFYCGGPT